MVYLQFRGCYELKEMHLFTWEGRVFAGSEFLKNVVENAAPDPDLLFEKSSSAAESASHILTSLYEQLDDICLLEDGEVCRSVL